MATATTATALPGGKHDASSHRRDRVASRDGPRRLALAWLMTEDTDVCRGQFGAHNVECLDHQLLRLCDSFVRADVEQRFKAIRLAGMRCVQPGRETLRAFELERTEVHPAPLPR